MSSEDSTDSDNSSYKNDTKQVMPKMGNVRSKKRKQSKVEESINRNQDPAVTEKLLVGPPFKVFLIDVAYLVFIYKIGPALMKNREPFKLKKLLLAYNFVQMVLNCIPLSGGFFMYIHYRVYEYGCMMGLPFDHPKKQIEILCFYTYEVLKFVDYLDTILFVLRKSWRQITFLHVYHHILMANASYLYLRYYGYGGHVGTMGILNSLVHVFMYFYYFMSALKPTMINALRWKKYVTCLQLIQFGIVFLHNLYPLLFRPDCKYPKFLFIFSMTQAIIMFYLFGKFYIKTYVRGENKNKINYTNNGIKNNDFKTKGINSNDVNSNGIKREETRIKQKLL